jgi:hypothetical protein
LLLLSVLFASACGDECEDNDGDGYGRGCEPGPDCDDTLASRNTDCSEPAPDCDEDPYAVGCTCYRGEERECYPADEATSGVGACHIGEQRCGTRGWLACEGSVLPTFERCNGLDDDCDGRSDETVRSPCGGCNDECRGGVWGEGDAPFTANDQLEVNPYGELVLRGHPLETKTVFVPNTGEGTLSAIDPDSALERARYRTLADEPAQIAIDYAGGAWVLGEQSDGGSALTHIAGDEASCVDRDGDGLDTSSGPSDVLPLGQDDCVLLDIALARELGRARGLAVSGLRSPDREAPVLWIGLPQERALIALDGESGEELERVETPSFRPYAAMFDPWGTLWAIDRDGWLARVETALSPPAVHVREVELTCYVLSSIAIDESGVITLAGAECESVARYDPTRESWTFVDMPGVLDARAVTTLSEDSWVTHTAGRLTRIAHEPLALGETYGLGSGRVVPFDSSAISGDEAQRLWIASSTGALSGGGLLTRFDVEAGRVTAQTELGFLPRPEGDMTGARRFTELEPEGRAHQVFTGCTQNENAGSSSGTTWHALHIAGVIGEGSSVDAAVRQADTRAELDDEDFVTVGTLPGDGSSFPLELDKGGAVEVRLILRTANHHGGPRIVRVGLEWSCPGPQ